MTNDEYSVKNIKYLSPHEHIRLRPGMYVGGTDSRALHQLAFEILHYVAEETFMGRCDKVCIELHENNVLSMRDNGVGLPVERLHDSDESMMEQLMYSPTARKILEKPPYWTWKEGIFGGIKLGIVATLSEKFTFETFRDGALWRQSYSEGLPTSELVGIRDSRSETGRGTTFTFHPDFSIFEQNDFDFDIIAKRAHEMAALVAGMTIEVRDLRTTPVREATFLFPEGLKSLVEELNADANPLHDVVHLRRDFPIPRRDQMLNLKVEVEIAFQFTEGDETEVRGYANTVLAPDGGTHVSALKTTLLACLNERLETTNFGQDRLLTWEEISHGLTAVISVFHPDPMYSGNITRRLENPEIFGSIVDLIYRAFTGEGSYPQRFILECIIDHHLERR